MERMVTVEELAQRFNVSPRTVLRLIQSREIRALRVGRQWRFKKEWIEQWVDKQTTEVQEDLG